MDKILEFLRNIFFTKIVGDITIYTIISLAFRFIFVFIVLYYIHMIVKLIILDIKNIDYSKKKKVSYLLFKLDENNEKRFNLESLNKIGRSYNNDIVLESPLISKEHATIVESNGVYYLVDNNSSNGTFLNGEKLDGNMELLAKDIIRIGDIELEFLQEYLSENELGEHYE